MPWIEKVTISFIIILRICRICIRSTSPSQKRTNAGVPCSTEMLRVPTFFSTTVHTAHPTDHRSLPQRATPMLLFERPYTISNMLASAYQHQTWCTSQEHRSNRLYFPQHPSRNSFVTIIQLLSMLYAIHFLLSIQRRSYTLLRPFYDIGIQPLQIGSGSWRGGGAGETIVGWNAELRKS